MKKDIHPKYHSDSKTKCSCGHVFTIASTKEYAEIETCSQCHPFYTGKEKSLDKIGRAEQFKKRLAKKKK